MKHSIQGIFSPVFFGIILLGLMGCSQPKEQPGFTPKDKEAILLVLNTQAENWSKGDIEKFMEGYWKSDSMQFIGKKAINFGWETTLNNYRKNYPDTAAMGKLRFEILRINPISADAAYLTGRFFLTRTIGDVDGIFTLVFRKIDGKWLCVYDHTS